MNKTLLIALVGLVFIQVCLSDLVDDAEAALDDLRQTVNDNLNAGFLEHIKMATDIDNVALETKDSAHKALLQSLTEHYKHLSQIKQMGNKVAQCHKVLGDLRKVAADELDTCVNDLAEEAINFIYTKGTNAVQATWSVAFDAEKQIVVCGLANDECLSGVVASIHEAIDSVPEVINAGIEVDREAVDDFIEQIRACGAKATELSKKMGRRCFI